MSKAIEANENKEDKKNSRSYTVVTFGLIVIVVIAGFIPLIENGNTLWNLLWNEGDWIDIVLAGGPLILVGSGLLLSQYKFLSLILLLGAIIYSVFIVSWLDSIFIDNSRISVVYSAVSSLAVSGFFETVCGEECKHQKKLWVFQIVAVVVVMVLWVLLVKF